MERLIILGAAAVTLFLAIFFVDWRYFRDAVVVFLFKSCLDLIVGDIVVHLGLMEYPARLFPKYFDTPIVFELWVFPILCILYNQITRERGLWPIFYYAGLFSAGITIVEYPIEIHTNLIHYKNWSWFINFIALTVTFLASRAFIAFFRWGCRRFPYTEQKHL